MSSESRHRATVQCVIPTHRRDALAARAIESVVKQSTRPDRIVVVDDTGQSRIRFMVGDQLRGVDLVVVDASGGPSPGASASRNAGAAAGTSDYVAFLDDDDWWLPEFLTECLDMLEYSEYDLVFCGLIRHYRGSLYFPAFSPHALVGGDEALASNPGMSGSNFVIRRSSFDLVGGFDVDLPVFNDLDFLVRCLDRGLRPGVVEKRLVVQDISPGAHLSSPGRRRADGILAYARKYRTRLPAAQLRSMQRKYYRALLGPSEPIRSRVVNAFHVARLTRPSEITRFVSSRISGGPRYDTDPHTENALER